ncbi:hypothetical protein AB205_0206570 [Aquarana catesbeiana]|uniref:Uncharacterized protein n=1 Tax=Aquarana catesbeiana TaxID=8400 RepID=A0A2G9NB43_AQUCT|nr:hypothetical protein AB205_0206570 [Aquarana catesbeiana]
MESKKEKPEGEVKTNLHRHPSLPKGESKPVSVKTVQTNSQEAEAVLLPHRPPPKVPGPRPVPVQRSGAKSEPVSLLIPYSVFVSPKYYFSLPWTS